MPLPQTGITSHTPLGATAGAAGSTLRTWAPNAAAVYAVTGPDLASVNTPGWAPTAASLMQPQGDGTWAACIPGLGVGDPYLYWIQGAGGAGPKRDPYARELGQVPGFPKCPCLVTDPQAYAWQATDWRTPPFEDFIIYQLHVGTWWATDASGADARTSRSGTFFDVASRLPYLQSLGITAIQLLPIQEFVTWYSLGYNGVDYFSPETDYQTTDPTLLQTQLSAINTLFTNLGKQPITAAYVQNGSDQLRCLIDLAHLHGIAMIFDLVYNHAGGGFDDASTWFYDRQQNGSQNNSLYFTDGHWAGGQIFAYWNNWVAQYLVDNATMFLREYRIDGIRYDEVRVMENNGGRSFCQSLTGTVRFVNPSVLQIAEYWNPDRPSAVAAPPGGLGFDAELGDALRDALRNLLTQLTAGAEAAITLDTVAATFATTAGIADAWRLVQCLENQDLTYNGHTGAARVATLADPSDHSSWYAASRARAISALLMTAPGIPMLFMGEEILEDRLWCDDRSSSNTLIWWDGVASTQARSDFLHHTTDLLALRRTQPALRGPNIRISRSRNDDRVLVIHRWLDDGADIIIIANLAEHAWYHYGIGLPWPGQWRELFNSDVYNNFPNPDPVGNGGSVTAADSALDGFGYSSILTLPANGLIALSMG
jgi:1,4-alpha-glucan branching enzyme